MLPWTLLDSQPGFYLVDKAPGIGMHSEAGTAGLIAQLQEALGERALYPVHRLDTVTSGLLLIARHRDSAAELGRQFAEHRVEKFYLALARGKPAKKQGRVSGAMAKARGGSYKLCRQGDKVAVTDFVSTTLSPGLRLYLLRPLTGKTHQLRVMMKSLSVPILGDRRYGPATEPSDRCYLHAWALRFQLGGREYAYHCPPGIGEYFQDGALDAALLDWAAPWQRPWPGRPASLLPTADRRAMQVIKDTSRKSHDDE